MEAWSRTVKTETIISGFRSSGTWPVDFSAIKFSQEKKMMNLETAKIEKTEMTKWDLSKKVAAAAADVERPATAATNGSHVETLIDAEILGDVDPSLKAKSQQESQSINTSDSSDDTSLLDKSFLTLESSLPSEMLSAFHR